MEASSLFLASITLHELELGLLLAERRDPTQGSLRRQWLEALAEGLLDFEALATAPNLLPSNEWRPDLCGANDINDIFLSLTILPCRRNIAGSIQEETDRGARHFLVVNSPDLSLTLAFLGKPCAAEVERT